MEGVRGDAAMKVGRGIRVGVAGVVGLSDPICSMTVPRDNNSNGFLFLCGIEGVNVKARSLALKASKRKVWVGKWVVAGGSTITIFTNCGGLLSAALPAAHGLSHPRSAHTGLGLWAR
jgi:hypothetical protein